MSTALRTASVTSSAVELRAVLVDDVVVALAELLADRGELLAEQVLAVLLVDALGDVAADRLGDTQLGEVLACPRVDRARREPPDRRRSSTASRWSASKSAHVATPSASSPGGLGGLEQLGKAARVAQPSDLGEHGAQLANGRLEARVTDASRGANSTSAYDGPRSLAWTAAMVARPSMRTMATGLARGHLADVGDAGRDGDVAAVDAQDDATVGAGSGANGGGEVGGGFAGGDVERQRDDGTGQQWSGDGGHGKTGHSGGISHGRKGTDRFL